MKKVLEILQSKQTMILSGIIFVLFSVLVIPYMANMLYEVTGTFESPDTLLNFSLDKYYNMLDQYSSSGRKLYIIQRWTFDLAWPLVYGVFLVSITSFVSSKLKMHTTYYFVPIIGVCFDLLENTIATVTMVLYPKQIEILYYLLRISTTLKWFVLLLSIISIIGLIIKLTKR